ncbi:MAG: PAS domain-containing sensor histidine kinase [Gammaproteobacteria bacterium]|nr:PAS domain-containing sensor histidine kinase [Gammaproteobacteria bacterium]
MAATKYLSITFAILTLLLGCSVMLGTVLHIPAMVQVIPGFVGMVFNSALLFILVGIAILVGNVFLLQKVKIILQVIGLFVFSYALLSLSQDIFAYDAQIDHWLIDPWIRDPNPSPGRMAPNTTIAFMLAGLTIFFLPTHENKLIQILLPLFTFFILLISLISILIYSLKLEYIFSWYHFTRMAVHTAAGLLFVSIGLWTLILQNPMLVKYYFGREDKKIIFLSGIVFIILTLITGFSSIAVITYSNFDFIHQALQNTLESKVDIFEDEIDEIQQDVNETINDENFHKLIMHAQRANAQNAKEYFSLIFVNDELTLKLVDPKQVVLYEQGQFIPSFVLSLPIINAEPTSLIWQNGFYLRFTRSVFSKEHKLIATLIGEKSLNSLNQLYTDYRLLGKTGENMICGRDTLYNIACFPTRLNPQIISFPSSNNFLPLTKALQGPVGSENALDYRRHSVVTSYKPTKTGLTFITKMDTQEIYKPVADLLVMIIPAAMFLILLGLGLLGWLVSPLVKKVIQSEQEAIERKIELQESQDRYSVAVDSSNTGLWDWGIKTDTFFASPLFKAMLGFDEKYTFDHLSNFMELIHPDDLESLSALFSDPKPSKLGFNIEYRLKNSRAEYGWYQTIGQYILNVNHQPIRMAGSLLDITERKRVQNLKNEFVSVVSHELRTPLTSIHGALSLILSGTFGNFSEKAHQLLVIANSNSDRLLNLISDILDIEKIEAGKAELKLQPININKIIQESITATRMYAEKFKITVILTTTVPHAKVRADKVRLMQVLVNLISNAVKFSPPNDKVEISIALKNDFIHVEVKDYGLGVSQKFSKHIFEKFSQADSSTTRKVSGTGLGLSISKELIAAMGGTIGFFNNPTKGATFYFTLPVWHDKHEKHNEML